MHTVLISVLKTEQALASEIFMHIKSADSRISLLDKLVRVSNIHEETKTIWKAILPKLRNANTHRNRLAHYQVIRITDTDGKIHDPILVPHWKMGKGPDQKPETYDIRRLTRLLADFNELDNLLYQLAVFIATGERPAK